MSINQKFRAKIQSADLPDSSRRRILRYGLHALGSIACGKLLLACGGGGGESVQSAPAPVTLSESSVPNLLLPRGFSARIIARSGEVVVPGGMFTWHPAPDGGAVFPDVDGGWIYVSNSEMSDGRGGVGAIRFHFTGEIIDAYSILDNTNRNCAGGPTPWNTWLSCEEIPEGHVWECDPYGINAPRELPALGTFNHEAVAVDPAFFQLYMTEDMPDGCFYRFTPASVVGGVPDLDNGVLEVARLDVNNRVSWHRVNDPSGATTPTRYQYENSTTFSGGEGAWYSDRIVYFTTKYDNRVWAYDIDNEIMTVIYDDDDYAEPSLTGVDNVTVSQAGTIYVAEDGGNMEIVAITPEQKIYPVMRLIGHEKSEVTGPAFDMTGTRLYFSSQRGEGGTSHDGITYEITGPFV